MSPARMPKYKAPATSGWHKTHEQLEKAFDLWGVRDWEAQPNVMISRANSTAVSRSERAVTVTFKKGDRTIVLASDSQESATANLKLIQLCIDDMRMIERRGLAETMQSAYMQLAAPASERDPFEVLGLRPGASPEDIEAMYRLRARAAHPDAGGSDEAMAELNSARDRALQSVR